MMLRIRHSLYLKVFCGLLGLHFLNISVDSDDLLPPNISEDLSFNDQESIVEIILEKVMGFENAIAEYDDPDTEEHNSGAKIKFDCFSSTTSSIFKRYLTQNSRRFLFVVIAPFCGHLLIDTPPPKA